MAAYSARIGRAVALVATLMCSGCIIPTTGVVSPALDGQIADARTHQPVANAQVTVHAGYSPKYDGPITIVLSDSSGHFLAPEKMGRIWMPPLPYDRLMPEAKISISAAGYESQSLAWDYYGTSSVIYLKQKND